MCIIVDANLASLVFAPQPCDDLAPVLHWLSDPDKDGCLVYGGRLGRELTQVAQVSRYLRTLLQAGRARLIPDSVTSEEEVVMANSGLGGLCVSNDMHVIALARVSGARTLCSHDQALHTDFKNPHLISKPRGSIYQAADHRRLLRHTASCGRRRGK